MCRGTQKSSSESKSSSSSTMSSVTSGAGAGAVATTVAVLAPPQIVDTTGAGDAFTAGLLHQLVTLTPAMGKPLQLSEAVVEQVVRYASACGALVCSGAGAIDPQPLPYRVVEFLEQLGS